MDIQIIINTPGSVIKYFLGRLDLNRFDELAEYCLEQIEEETDSVYLSPFCQEDFRKINVLGQGFDKKRVNDEVLSKLF